MADLLQGGVEITGDVGFKRVHKRSVFVNLHRVKVKS